MLDLDTLRIIRREQPNERRFSFVGIRLSPSDGTPEFWLPQGFHTFPTGDFDRTVRLFFDLFKVMREFVDSRDLRSDQRKDKRDPLQVGATGLNFALDTELPLLTFAKLNLLERTLESFDELVLSAVVTKQAHRSAESHNEVHRHLHNAVFLEDDRIHFESLPSARREVFSGATQLVRAFCFIYGELVTQIYGRDAVARDVAVNAAAFREDHLAESAGLFAEGSFKSTLRVLKEVLDRIDRTTPYKDDDFWQLFNAVEVFLYGDVRLEADEDGVVWGISDFHPVWEEMCHAYTRQLFDEVGDRKIVFSHNNRGANTSIGRARVFTTLGGANPFCIRSANRQRHMLPDMVATSTDPEEALRRQFGAMLAVSFSPPGVAVPNQISIRASTEVSVAESWLDGLKRKLSKAGWHPLSPSRGQAIVKNIPAKKFASIFRTLESEFVGKRKPRPKDVYIIDFKYQHPAEYCGRVLSAKIQADILKQNAYELAYQYYSEDLGEDVLIHSQFVVPLYAPTVDQVVFLSKSMPPEMEGYSLNPDFFSYGIDLIALPFGLAADAYVG